MSFRITDFDTVARMNMRILQTMVPGSSSDLGLRARMEDPCVDAVYGARDPLATVAVGGWGSCV